jgi:putative membrane protein
MPHKSPYARFDTSDLTLRDALAVDRTVVANERTLLGYIRTTLALLAAGGSLLHFLSGPWAAAGGIALLVLSVPMFVLGVNHYLVRRRHLAPLIRVVDAPPE